VAILSVCPSTPLPPSVWPHVFGGAGHEKRKGEQLNDLYCVECDVKLYCTTLFIHSFINTHKAAEKKHYTHNIHTIKKYIKHYTEA